MQNISGHPGEAVAAETPVLSRRTQNGAARMLALQSLPETPAPATTLVEYHSQGRLVIIGPAQAAIPVAERLLAQLPSIVIIDPSQTGQDIPCDDRVLLLHAGVASLRGHLGDFDIQLQDRGNQTLKLQACLNRNWSRIDLVLDLLPAPCFDAEISPPGYFASRNDAAILEQHLQVIPDMVGQFEKPRYFRYDPAICAHARNQKTACTQCIDVCPTLAIHSLGERVDVDPYLCQGGGSCAATCPSGAMQYIYPPLANLLERIRHLLQHYQQAGGQDARLLLVDSAHCDSVYSRLAELEENLIPVVLDEIGVIDLAIMLNALAYGAQQIIILIDQDTLPARVLGCLQAQVRLAHTFLTGLGYTESCIALTDLAALSSLPLSQDLLPPAATYAAFNEKRTMIRLALEHLNLHAPQPTVALPLYAGAPFGEIRVDPQTCTLCFACTGVCPTSALLAGNDTPQLNFIEDHCVQCGLCEQTCPEQAIRRYPRYLFDPERRRNRRQLYAETPFCCVRCGKPFATQHMIDNMLAKLSGHWMFASQRALQRLKMCEDCRVADLWDEQGS